MGRRNVNKFFPARRNFLKFCSEKKYLNDCGCTFTNNNLQSICWLLGYALRLNDEHGTERGSDANNGYLTNIDGESQEFRDGVDQLSKLLKVPPHPDPHV